MGSFSTYLRLGYEHIVNLNALDHIVFIIALMAAFQPKSWLRVIAAVTFFTIGHSISLTLTAFNLISINKELIEFLIPVTILVTAIFNLTKPGQDQSNKTKYWIAGVLGIIHGIGFAHSYDLLVLGEGTYWSALLPFNLGVELGQLLVVFLFLILTIVFQYILNFKHYNWNLFFSGGAFGLALFFCLRNWPF